MLILGAGCLHTQPGSVGKNESFSLFRQADPSDRAGLAEPTIVELRKRMGMHTSELTKLIGRPEIWDSEPGTSQHADLKYTVYHKNDTWRYFVIRIRDWKVVWVGDVETVTQM